MRYIFSVLLLALVALALFTGPAAGQPDPSDPFAPLNGTNTTDSTAYQNAETIDNNTVLLASNYDSEAGTVTVTLRSDVLQDVTISDSGAFVEGGVVEQRKQTLRPDKVTRIEIPVTRTSDGFVGVSISTRDTLYAEPIDVSNPLIPGPWTARDAQLVGLTVGLTTVVIAGISIVRYRRNSGADPGRLA